MAAEQIVCPLCKKLLTKVFYIEEGQYHWVGQEYVQGDDFFETTRSYKCSECGFELTIDDLEKMGLV